MVRSEVQAATPADGALRVGDVELPDGLTLGSGWITVEPVAGSGAVWTALVLEFPSSGLWPIEIEPSLFGRVFVPEDELQPVPVSAVDKSDAAAVFSEMWASSREFRLADEWPTSFEGLASESSQVSETAPVLTSESRELHLLLVPVSRPADVPAVLGWNPAIFDSVATSAVLRSWEDRYGWYLQSLGVSSMILAGEPVDPAQVDFERLAVELVAFSPEFEIEQSRAELAYDLASRPPAGVLFFW